MTSKEVCVVEFGERRFGVKVVMTKRYFIFWSTTITGFVSSCFNIETDPWRIKVYCNFTTKKQAYTHMQQYLLTHKEL